MTHPLPKRAPMVRTPVTRAQIFAALESRYAADWTRQGWSLVEAGDGYDILDGTEGAFYQALVAGQDAAVMAMEFIRLHVRDRYFAWAFRADGDGIDLDVAQTLAMSGKRFPVAA